jgi:transposase
MRPFGTARELEQRRMLAVHLLLEGLSAAEVARLTQVDPRSVRRWRAAACANGETGVAAKPAGGRPRRLSTGNLALLRWLLLDVPRAFGVPAGLRSCAEVAALIQRQFGVHYHRAHVNRILHTLGIMPRKRCR